MGFLLLVIVSSSTAVCNTAEEFMCSRDVLDSSVELSDQIGEVCETAGMLNAGLDFSKLTSLCATYKSSFSKILLDSVFLQA